MWLFPAAAPHQIRGRTWIGRRARVFYRPVGEGPFYRWGPSTSPHRDPWCIDDGECGWSSAPGGLSSSGLVCQPVR